MMIKCVNAIRFFIHSTCSDRSKGQRASTPPRAEYLEQTLDLQSQ